jgi:acetylornithine deacetylase
MEIDTTFLTETLVELVQTDSRNPALTPGSPGEVAVAAYTAQRLRDLGLDVFVHEVAPNRPNVVGILRGTGGGKSLLLNAHMDTVGVEGMDAPFSAEIRDGKLYGRGSQDMKGSLAAMIAAAKAIVDAGITLSGDLLITAVADEEYVSIGMDDLVQHYSADAAIVTEPTDMRLCRAHRGFVWCTVESKGRAAHGSRYDEGIDAIMRMGRFLGELDGLEQDLRQRPAHSLVGTPSLHASMIEGGTEISIYAAKCTLKIERRTNPGESVAQATAEIEALSDRLNAADPTNQLTLSVDFSRPAFEIGADRPIVKVVERALANRLGQAAPHVGATFWTDAAILAEAGIDTVLLGPIGAGLHSAEEWVDLQSVIDLAAVLADTAVTFCH